MITSLIGDSPAMERLRATLRRLARFPLPVLIVGESGTGKEAAARSLHCLGPRRERPFVAENCAALPAPLLESLLFGHVRGAFTGAERDHQGLFRQANGGTLFLDEICEMPVTLQARLLRVLQEREVRPVGGRETIAVTARIVAATNRNPTELLSRGNLRPDLYYRLSGAVLELPPLRQRPGDVRSLARHFLKGARAQWDVTPHELSEEALRALESYRWPGNVRELLQEIERAASMCDAAIVERRDLSPSVRQAGGRAARGPRPTLESEMIETALGDSGGCVAGAAGRIGWSRQKLYRRMDRLKIPRPGRRYPP